MTDPKDALIERAATQADEEATLDESIFATVQDEINRQAVLAHGGNTYEFDKANSRNDWIAYCTAYLGRAAHKVLRNEREKQEFETNMVKVAALAVAAIRAHRKGYC